MRSLCPHKQKKVSGSYVDIHMVPYTNHLIGKCLLFGNLQTCGWGNDPTTEKEKSKKKF